MTFLASSARPLFPPTIPKDPRGTSLRTWAEHLFSPDDSILPAYHLHPDGGALPDEADS